MLDGHGSHLSVMAIEFCEKNGIEMLCIPPHTSHRLKLCDTHFNKPLKEEVSKYLRRHEKVVLMKFEFYIPFTPVWSAVSSRRSLLVDGSQHCEFSLVVNPPTSQDFN
jgi:hypothetical protein